MKVKNIRRLISFAIILIIMFSFSLRTLAVSSREAISAQLDYCASLNSGWYQPKTWDALQKAIAAAKPYVDITYGTDQEATDKLGALNNAVVGLKKLANLDALKATIRNLGYLNEKEFKPESFKSFLTVVASAKSAVANLNSSQITIDKMQNDLAIAQSKLIKIDGSTCKTVDRVDAVVKKDVLNASIYNVSYLNKGMFTETSWGIFMLTYNVAKDKLISATATQDAVTQIQNDLVISESNLEKDPASTSYQSIELAEFPDYLRVGVTVPSTQIPSTAVPSTTITPTTTEPSTSVTTSKVAPITKVISTETEVYDVGSTILLIVIIFAVVVLGFVGVIFGRKLLKKRGVSNVK